MNPARNFAAVQSSEHGCPTNRAPNLNRAIVIRSDSDTMILRTVLLTLVAVYTAAAQTGVDPDALDRLDDSCKESHSSSYSVWVNGKPAVSWHDPSAAGPIPCHSVLKSIASLAVGRLLADGSLDSLDTPVYAFYPEWHQGYRKSITVRHLLNHTSGIDFSESTMEEWGDAPDQVQVALCSDLVSPAGQYFNYNNKAFVLLLGIIGRASGMPTHRYIEKAIFAPLDITDYAWEFDGAGNTTGLSITSDELVKIGQLVLDKGTWMGRRLVPEEWIDLSLQPGQPYVGNCGLMWWLLPKTTSYIVDDAFLEELRNADIDKEIVDRFESIRGTYTDVNIPEGRLVEAFGEDWQGYLDRNFYPYFPARSRREYSPDIVGYKAEGWLGQYIVIYPEKRLVAARMIRNSEDYSAATDEFREFERHVYELVK